ncbi:MAG: M1 family metallopeptidase [Oscillochloris sp.]|nr:M1 family metallopeptidase [Oscillochloris sp.]
MPRALQFVGFILCIASLALGACAAVNPTPTAGVAPPDLPAAPQIASYNLDVSLNPDAKTVSGSGTITYRNPSQDALDSLWLRLYLKAFSSPDTTWMRESGGEMRGYATGDEGFGDITLSRLALPDGTDLLADATADETLVQVPLPDPLIPDQQITLEVSWTSTLPRVFARTGYGGRDDTFFMVGQWYPKMVVYDRGEWDTEPWHANAEFFHDFGRYEVAITAPDEYVVAGVGMPVGEPQVQGDQRIHRFVAEDVTDFAFAASPDFEVHTRQAGHAEVVLYLLPEHRDAREPYLSSAAESLVAYSEWFGAYPHQRLSVIDVPDDAGGAGGMEYPTLITGGTLGAPGDSGFLELIVAHEVAHQWWPMQTATNEAREPWLDEGLTEYSGARFMAISGRDLGNSLSAPALDLAQYAADPSVRSDLPAWEYGGDYAIAAYSKPAVGLFTLERVVGSEHLLAAMARYLEEQRFRHPTQAEFRQVLEAELGDLDWFFDQFIGGVGVIDYAISEIKSGPQGSSAQIVREGDVAAPLSFQIEYADGSSEVRTWDGEEAVLELNFSSEQPPTAIILDPEYALYAELDRRDNGFSAEVAYGPLLTIAARLSYWTQTIVQTVGLFG